jgi:tRNA-intron endonuclease
MEKRQKKIKAIFSREIVISDTKEAKEMYNQSRFGELKENKIQYSLVEALYLLEKKKMLVYDSRSKKITADGFMRRAKKIEPNFWVRYCVFKDIRQRGYIVKTALKFGADFRVYDRGVKPGEDHAKWILFPVYEGETFSWYDFAAKNRVAHSTRKRLLLAIVDNESDVTYYEIAWTRP